MKLTSSQRVRLPNWLLIVATTLMLVKSGPVLGQSGETPLQANDKITISIGGVPAEEVVSISKTYAISDSGTINLLHINEVRAAGMKPSALQKRIEEAYKAGGFYTNPTVTVSMDSTGETARQVFVNYGCVRNGPVPFRPGLTLLQAIGSAGGPTPFAKTTKVELTRNNTGGQRTTTIHDMKKIGKNPSLDVPLQPNDNISIPQ
jgi:polysaccharide biosynthesis/export protein